MATIYTNIGDVSPPARTDYFEGVKGAITDYSKKKEDDNQARLDAVAKIPTLSTTQMWDSHFAAAQEMDEDLRDSLDGASESPESMAAWERKLQQRMDFVKEAEAYYGKTAELALKRAVIAGDPSLNPKELFNAGKIDDHSEDHYRSNMERLDDPGEFAGVTSTEDGFVLGGGINPFDVFSDTEWLNVDPVNLEPQRPEGYWGSHVGKATDMSEIDVTNTIIGLIEQDQRDIQNAKVWWSKNANDGEGMPIENVDQRTAVEEYAKEAAKSRIKAKEKKSTLEKNQRAKLEGLVDGIQTGMSVESPSSQGSVQSSYAALTGKNIYVGGNFDEDAVEGDEGKKYEVSGVYLSDDNRPVFQLMTNKGNITVESNYNEDLYKQIESQMTNEYGKDALKTLLGNMQLN